jgi:tRNA (guanine26-N2/guanine27-N2)-dimethyltransferase
LRGFPFELEEVVEGGTRLLVPVTRTTKGPGKRSDVFYNAAMRFNRDVAILVVGSLSKDRNSSFKVLDGLAATGALGLRLANEVGGLDVTLNDRNPLAFDLIKMNVEGAQLGEGSPKVENENMNALLHKRRFDYIDVDPYGSPVPFMDDSFRALYREGYVGITATDKAPLCGVYPKACLRKYLSLPMKTQYSDEIGLRILVGYSARTAAKYGLGVTPILSYSFQHHFRTYLRVEDGARKADIALKSMGYANHDRKSGKRFCSTNPVEDLTSAGPLWIGPLFDRDIVSSLRPRTYMNADVLGQVQLWKEEMDSPPLYYTSDEISKTIGTSPPPLDSLIGKIRSSGFAATRTHFSPIGFKTDAPIEDLKGFFKT